MHVFLHCLSCMSLYWGDTMIVCLGPNLLREWEWHLKLCRLPLQIAHLVGVVNEAHIALPSKWASVDV